jgi:serine/threonine protein kinase
MDVIADKYEIEKILGEGGAGTVYLVKHTDLGVKYALKLLKKELVDQRFIDRFKREAEVLIKFNHPGSVALRDFGKTSTGEYYMAMDYCEGKTLKKLLDDIGEMPIRRVFNIMEQLLTALVAAHKVGIIHRDIKPENIMLTEDEDKSDSVKILDFGIAKLKEKENDSSKTMDGVSVGTPQYMSPEQASGESNLDHRVDIYSLGCVFYEMLTGKSPFIGDSVIQTLILHLTQPPAKFAEEFGLPDYVETLVFKSLEKDREARYQTAQEFLDSLANVKELIFKTKENNNSSELISSKEVKTIQNPNNTKAPLKILCLDDSDMILHIFKHILEEKGFTVFTANNSSAVHQYLFQDKVDLLVTDVQMPDIPGTKVCSMLKRTVPDLKVVLFSNLPEKELDKMTIENKADGWISKNTKPAEWVEKIQQVLAQ